VAVERLREAVGCTEDKRSNALRVATQSPCYRPGVATTVPLGRGDDGKREVVVEAVAGFIEVRWQGSVLRLTPAQAAILRDALDAEADQAKRLAQTIS
jgi:hypothetical protein